MIKKILNLEGLVFFLFCLFFYQMLSGNWLVFILLLFTPDISMIGYLKNTKLGAIIYNIGHTYITAGLILAVGLLLNNHIATLGSIILGAHISLDRALGFGLKYPTHFKDTHMQKI